MHCNIFRGEICALVDVPIARYMVWWMFLDNGWLSVSCLSIGSLSVSIGCCPSFDHQVDGCPSFDHQADILTSPAGGICIGAFQYMHM